MLRNLSEIKRQAPEALLAGLLNENPGDSKRAGEMLIKEARSFGLSMRDFLTLSVVPAMAADPKAYSLDGSKLLDGYNATLAYLKLPVKDDLENGITLELAGETFQTFPGTRTLFPEVVDDMVHWKYKQGADRIPERIENLVGSSRTISGVEMLTQVVDDKASDYRHGQPIAEGARVPIRSIRATSHAVNFFKFGQGYQTTYEFQRRVRLDLLTPYAARAQRELEMSKVSAAVQLLVSGDAVYGPAPVVNQSAYDGNATVDGKIHWRGLLGWLTARAKAGVPVDTVAGNWDAALQWLLMFAVPTATSGSNLTEAELLAKTGFQVGGVPILSGVVNFALATDAPAGKLIGYSKADTVEELKEANSLINESERSVQTQEISYYQTENAGYRLVFGDTRSIYDFTA